MNKTLTIISFWLVFPFAACYADTVAWWRFDEKTSGESTSAAEELVDSGSNGVGGKAISISGAQEGSDAALLPKFCSAKHGLDTVEIYDPVSGISRANVAALSFQTEKTASGLAGAAVRVADDEALRLSDFTIEAFVCTTGGTFNTIAPIAGKIKNGGWTSESWQIGLLSNGKLFMRYDGTNSDVHGDGSAVISDGAWHHVALTCAYDAEKNLSTYTMYVDYRMDFVKTKTGRTSYQTSGNNDIYIGGYGYVNGSEGRKFNGLIDEVRLSNVALGAADFLRRRWVESPLVDEDTLVFLPFGGMSGYTVDVAERGVSAIPVSCGTDWTLSEDVPFALLRDGRSSSQQVTNAFSQLFFTNGVNRAGSAVKLEKYAWANGDFTTELFFKTGSRVSSLGDAQMLFKLANKGQDPVMQAMVNNESGHLGCIRIVYQNNGKWSSNYIGSDVDDGLWHHFAVVYDRALGELKCYLDYELELTVNQAVLRTDETDGAIGSRIECDQQFFHGLIDSFRITRRKLAAGEFIAPEGPVRHEEAETLMRAPFDGDYFEAGSDPSWFVSGRGIRRDENLESCHMPQFAESVKWSTIALDGRGGENAVTNKSSVFLNGSVIVFENVPDVGPDDQTVEIFCNIESLPAFAGIVRLNNHKDQIVGVDPVWALYRSDGDETILARCTMKNDGETEKGVYIKTGVTVASLSGGWHHFAMTIRYDAENGKTEFSFYVDGELKGAKLEDGRLYADPASGYNVMMGASLKPAASLVEPDTVGYFDELRISRGVLPPEKFMYRYARKGCMVIVR